MQNNTDRAVWLVYDGDCPICRLTANALKIREAVGVLHLINAREHHSILEELKITNLNLDEGMVVKFQNTLYHGADAQHVLAMIGTKNDWFNRINVILFRSRFVSKLIYPVLRSARNLILKINNISKLNNLGKNNG